MALFTEKQIRDRYWQELNIRDARYFSADTILNENKQIAESKTQFDIFLSHSSNDNELISGLTLLLQDLGYSIYVDWIDAKLDKNRVTPETAAVLRERMQQCKSMIYAFSESASNSKWMPWELGYFDGLKNNKVAVLPISKISKSIYTGSEYVGLYYHIQIDKINGSDNNAIWVHEDSNYVNFESWLGGKLPYKH